jgi:myo-inositol-1(or 4)-monophosphatase
MILLDQVIVFAAIAHSGQVRKGTKTPYILHPLEAAVIVASMTDDPEIIAAAILHDTLEDANVSLAEITSKFGPRVAWLVQAETENKRKDLPAADTWLIRKQETIDALKVERDVAVKMVTLGDKLSNIRTIYRDHLAIGDKLWERFNQKDPKMHAWYYRAIAEATMELKHHPAWQEYNLLVEKVFSKQS